MKIKTPPGLAGKKLFDYLAKNASALIETKKMERKKADAVTFPGELFEIRNDLPKDASTKAAKYRFKDDEEKGVLERTIVMNTYLWLDTHDDVHMPNLFAKSLKERGAYAPHLHDHKFEIDAKVGIPIKWYEQEITWAELGVSIPGKTMSLFLESEILKEYNPKIYMEYLRKRIDQHSVYMGYSKVSLAINDEDYKEEFKVWKEVIDRIGNKERAEEQGYFYAIREAMLFEGSAVLVGANEVTPTLENKSALPGPPTEEEKPKPLFALGDISKMVNYYEQKRNTK